MLRGPVVDLNRLVGLEQSVTRLEHMMRRINKLLDPADAQPPRGATQRSRRLRANAFEVHFDAAWDRVWASEPYLDFLGLTLDAWLRGNPADITHPSDRVRDRRLRLNVMRTKTPYCTVLRMIGRDGSTVRVRWADHPILDRNGNIARILSKGELVTDTKS